MSKIPCYSLGSPYQSFYYNARKDLRVLYFAKHNTKTFGSAVCLRILYFVQVRPISEYGIIVWHLYSVADVLWFWWCAKWKFYLILFLYSQYRLSTLNWINQHFSFPPDTGLHLILSSLNGYHAVHALFLRFDIPFRVSFYLSRNTPLFLFTPHPTGIIHLYLDRICSVAWINQL